MNREVHVRFWENPEVKILRATRPKRTFSADRPTDGFLKISQQPVLDTSASISGLSE